MEWRSENRMVSQAMTRQKAPALKRAPVAEGMAYSAVWATDRWYLAKFQLRGTTRKKF